MMTTTTKTIALALAATACCLASSTAQEQRGRRHPEYRSFEYYHPSNLPRLNRESATRWNEAARLLYDNLQLERELEERLLTLAKDLEEAGDSHAAAALREFAAAHGRKGDELLQAFNGRLERNAQPAQFTTARCSS